MRLFALFFLNVLTVTSTVPACSVPIFRYALEHWPADHFEAVVYHRGTLSETQQAAARDLGAEGLAGALHANVSVQTVDLTANPDAGLLALAPSEIEGPFPWVVVKVPRTVKSGATVWSGPLTTDSVAQILDSPSRKEIVERLAQGGSAVWVLLESGVAAKDSAAARLLDEQLTELKKTLTLPRLAATDIANGLGSVAPEDLRLDFSVLRVARDDAAEQPFVQMLLGTGRDLKDAKEPIVIPIFGRGRALSAFVGAGLQAKTIAQAARFLIGKCSCEAKELNPGADLLIAADWDGLLKSYSAVLPDHPTLAELTQSPPQTVTIAGTKPTVASGPKVARSPGARAFWMIVTIVGVGLSAVSLPFLIGRRR